MKNVAVLSRIFCSTLTLYWKLTKCPFLFFSDCEKTDVVDIAKDEELGEKLLSETLRALKLDGANLDISHEKINDSKKKV